ncbi:trans-sulfuration enzyme family protein [Campylobacter californiensis]|uniref:trans-sulfuration enzyme family protein n=1 Tax=Campylobacter californiensis TaxID=1032243 RepID=UPI001474C903|nr:PLP-dependent aspartate aminotransferase family protein [Campylobacter sp. RM12916]MBE3610172.1 PLP-dependent transferase [Campylobacter sp. RM12916]
MKLDTLIVKGINAKDNPYQSVVPPIFLATSFVQNGLDDFQKYGYSRGANPTRNAFEELFAKIEGSRYCLATASGMAATTLAFSLFKTGDKILLNNNTYGGTYRYADTIFKNQGLKYELVDDFNTLNEDEISSDVKAIFIETPSNPLLRVTDIKRIVNIAHKKGIMVIADNTFLTPYYQHLLELGVDVVVYSATKYIGGHADVIAGIVTTNSDELAAKLDLLRNSFGSMLSPADSYYLIKGLKTLSVRFDRQTQNTHKIIEFLSKEEAVSAVHYAGSYSKFEKEAQEGQATGIGALISFEIDPKYDCNKFVKSLRIFDLAVSLGGVESLVCHPASMTHDSYPKELQEKIGIKENLLRMAVGVENSDDLMADLKQAFTKAKI